MDLIHFPFFVWGVEMESYLFYDIETTGLNKSFDQILQFAAIRTDEKLNKIDEHVIYIKLRQDVIPSPMAMITHQISIEECNLGMIEYEAVKKIHSLLNTPGTVSVGYNTMRFDDEFLRFSFYRNLLTPYTHQFLNGCGRMDILPMAVIYRLYKTSLLIWPNIDGKPSMKLENINNSNGLVTGRAHDAMVDVQATLELAKIFCKEKKMWDYLVDCFSKKIDLQKINKFPISFSSILGGHSLAILVDNKIGTKAQYRCIVLGIGNSIPYSNQMLWLRMDNFEFETVDSEKLQEKIWVIRKRAGEPGILLPLKDRFLNIQDKNSQSIAEKNLQWLQNNQKTFIKIINFHREFSYPVVPEQDIDAMLYTNGFMSKQDLTLCKKFHRENLNGKISLINKFQDNVTKNIATRLLSRNFLEKIPKDLCCEYNIFLKKAYITSDDKPVIDYKGEKKTVVSDVTKEIEQLNNANKSNNKNQEQQKVLNNLSNYLKKQTSLNA